MPVEAKPLFRPDVLRSHLAGYQMPAVDSAKLKHWANLITTGRLAGFGEQEILPDFLSDFFVELLGYLVPVGQHSLLWNVELIHADRHRLRIAKWGPTSEERLHFRIVRPFTSEKTPLNLICAGRGIQADRQPDCARTSKFVFAEHRKVQDRRDGTATL